MKRLIALTLALVLFFSTNALSFRTAAVNNYSVDTPYTYPVVPGTDAWAVLETTPTDSGYYVHTAIRLNQNYYYSKWGIFGVFSHSKTRNPYYNPYDEIANNQILTGVSYWRWDYEVIED